MTRFALTVEYDGRPFQGWQRQEHGPSVQQALEEAAQAVTGERTTVHAAGRTDTGVHACAMRAHLDLTRTIAPFRLMEALNARLRPAPVAILTCETVADDWHARFSCLARHYEYRIVNRRAPLTFAKGLAWRVVPPLDVTAMQAGAAHLRGRHDFTTFRSAHCQAASPLRTLDRLDVIREGETVRIFASARSFLHHQVRSMVGCLALVGQGKWSPTDIATALAARNRAALGFNAPSDGLYFLRADYPGEEDALHALRREIATGGARPSVIDRYIETLLTEDSNTLAADLLAMLSDKAEYDEGMFSLIHAAESLDDASYVSALLSVFPTLLARSPRWVTIVLMRVMNSDASRQELVRQLPDAPVPARKAIRIMCDRIDKTSPEFSSKTVAIALAAK